MNTASTVVPVSPSVTLTSSIEMSGMSSLRMVPTPCASAIVALAGLLRLMKNVSSSSMVSSPLTVTAIGWLTTPGAKVSVPLVAT